jgi:hypothetical protein
MCQCVYKTFCCELLSIGITNDANHAFVADSAVKQMSQDVNERKDDAVLPASQQPLLPSVSNPAPDVAGK